MHGGHVHAMAWMCFYKNNFRELVLSFYYESPRVSTGSLDFTAGTNMTHRDTSLWSLVCFFNVCLSCSCVWDEDRWHKCTEHKPLSFLLQRPWRNASNISWLHGSLPGDRPGCGFHPELCKTEPPTVTGKHDSSEEIAGLVSQQCCLCGQKTFLCEAVLCLWTVRSSTLQLELVFSDTISISQGHHCPPSLFRAISLGNLGSWDLSLRASLKEAEIIWAGGYSWMTG